MTPDISEFSYGFAVTHEIANSTFLGVRAAPIFPSLIEEGKKGGGYDVKLDANGIPVFLQFKRADYMIGHKAKQLKDGVATPFFRFAITERRRSAQHDLLLELDVPPNEVYYVAPRFYTVSELNDAYQAQAIVDRSFFIRPRDIGPLDENRHCVAFNTATHVVCSEPREIPALEGRELQTHFRRRLDEDSRPLRTLVDKSLSIFRQAVRDRDMPLFDFDPGRSDKTPDERDLRTVADLALRYLNAQFFVVQDIDVKIVA